MDFWNWIAVTIFLGSSISSSVFGGAFVYVLCKGDILGICGVGIGWDCMVGMWDEVFCQIGGCVSVYCVRFEVS